MSFLFASLGKACYGTKSSALTSVSAVTIGFFYKVTTYTFGYMTAVSNVLSIGGDYGDQYLVCMLYDTPSPYLNTRNHYSDGTEATHALSYANSADTWVGVVASLTSNGSRQIWQKPWGGSITTDGAVSAGPQVTSSTLQYMYAGQASGNNGEQYAGKLAELSLWTSILSQADREAFLAGTSAQLVSPSTLKGYWFIKDQTTRTNNVTGETWTLSTDTATGTTAPAYNSDHPLITYGSNSILLQETPGTNPTSKIYMLYNAG